LNLHACIMYIRADEQMRFLSHCIEKICNYMKPLPRFWYFDDTKQASNLDWKTMDSVLKD